MIYLIYIGAFLITILIDICFTYHVIAAAKNSPFESALSNSFGNLLSKSLVFLYINEPFVVISIFLGSFIGTYLATRFQKYIEQFIENIHNFIK